MSKETSIPTSQSFLLIAHLIIPYLYNSLPAWVIDLENIGADLLGDVDDSTGGERRYHKYSDLKTLRNLRLLCRHARNVTYETSVSRLLWFCGDNYLRKYPKDAPDRRRAQRDEIKYEKLSDLIKSHFNFSSICYRGGFSPSVHTIIERCNGSSRVRLRDSPERTVVRSVETNHWPLGPSREVLRFCRNDGTIQSLKISNAVPDPIVEADLKHLMIQNAKLDGRTISECPNLIILAIRDCCSLEMVPRDVLPSERNEFTQINLASMHNLQSFYYQQYDDRDSARRSENRDDRSFEFTEPVNLRHMRHEYYNSTTPSRHRIAFWNTWQLRHLCTLELIINDDLPVTDLSGYHRVTKLKICRSRGFSRQEFGLKLPINLETLILENLCTYDIEGSWAAALEQSTLVSIQISRCKFHGTKLDLRQSHKLSHLSIDGYCYLSRSDSIMPPPNLKTLAFRNFRWWANDESRQYRYLLKTKLDKLEIRNCNIVVPIEVDSEQGIKEVDLVRSYIQHQVV